MLQNSNLKDLWCNLTYCFLRDTERVLRSKLRVQTLEMNMSTNLIAFSYKKKFRHLLSFQIKSYKSLPIGSFFEGNEYIKIYIYFYIFF